MSYKKSLELQERLERSSGRRIKCPNSVHGIVGFTFIHSTLKCLLLSFVFSWSSLAYPPYTIFYLPVVLLLFISYFEVRIVISFARRSASYTPMLIILALSIGTSLLWFDLYNRLVLANGLVVLNGWFKWILVIEIIAFVLICFGYFWNRNWAPQDWTFKLERNRSEAKLTIRIVMILCVLGVVACGTVLGQQLRSSFKTQNTFIPISLEHAYNDSIEPDNQKIYVVDVPEDTRINIIVIGNLEYFSVLNGAGQPIISSSSNELSKKIVFPGPYYILTGCSRYNSCHYLIKVYISSPPSEEK